MKTQTVYSSIIVLGMVTGLSVFAETVPSPLLASLKSYQKKEAIKKAYEDEADLNVGNFAIQSIINRILVSEDQVEWFMPKFDLAHSSLKNERISYSASGKVKNTQYGGNAQATARAEISTDRTSWQTGVQLKVEGSLTTDVLAAVRYSGKLTLENLQNDVLRVKQYKNEFIALTQRLSSVATIEELHGIMLDSQKLSFDYISFMIRKDQDDINCAYRMECGDVKIDQWGNRQIDSLFIAYRNSEIAKLRGIRASSETTRFILNDSKTTITIEAPTPQGFSSADTKMSELKSVSITFEAQKLQTSGSVFMEFSIKQLDRLHADIMNSINQLNQGDQNKIDEVEKGLRKGLKAFKNALAGKFNSNQATTTPSNP